MKTTLLQVSVLKHLQLFLTFEGQQIFLKKEEDEEDHSLRMKYVFNFKKR